MLIKYTHFTSMSDLVFKKKAVECVKAILDVAYTDGNWLDAGWLDVLRCVSHVEKCVNSKVNIVSPLSCSPPSSFNRMASPMVSMAILASFQVRFLCCLDYCDGMGAMPPSPPPPNSIDFFSFYLCIFCESTS